MSVANFHERLLGVAPSEQHLKFYEASARGFNKSDFDQESFLASFILAVHDAKQGPVVVVVPKALEKEILGAMTASARLILRRFKGKPVPVKSFTDAVKKLRLASVLLEAEPERWVSIGLSDQDPIPSWLRSKLWPTN